MIPVIMQFCYCPKDKGYYTKKFIIVNVTYNSNRYDHWYQDQLNIYYNFLELFELTLNCIKIHPLII